MTTVAMQWPELLSERQMGREKGVQVILWTWLGSGRGESQFWVNGKNYGSLQLEGEPKLGSKYESNYAHGVSTS